MDSILNTIKKMLGIDASYTVFDEDIINDINTAFFSLYQIGVGDQTVPFTIQDDSATWSDFTAGLTDTNTIKTYIYEKVRLMFDPPTSSFVLSSIENQIRELEWRLNVHAEIE